MARSRGPSHSARMLECCARGERVATHRLTTALVLWLRAAYRAGGVTYRALAAEIGVCHASVWRAVTGRSWSHIEGAVV